MKTIKSKKELKDNLTRFESYLSKSNNEEEIFAKKHIAAGKCFVTYKINQEWRFVPSRFSAVFMPIL